MPGQTRRRWLATVPASLAAASADGAAATERPNIILIISDQFRWDNVGAMGLNPMNLTPNLDRMAGRGVLFRSAFSNQPVCAPARASIFTSQYPSRHGVWHNGPGLEENATTLATTLRGAGYSANYIGKWHLAPGEGRAAGVERGGAVKPAHRGGFLDLWEASNELEWTSRAYEGDLFDNDGRPIHYAGQYRADFMTERAVKFLRGARQPFLLGLSYLETHHQNQTDTFDPPADYKGRYTNPFVPQDLRPLPGTWPSQLADYYACVARIDDAVGTIRRTLAETGLDRNTIVAFTADHGCHFKTRNSEYKRSPHESSIHIPLIIEGPGFNRSAQVTDLVSQVDLAPTLIEAAGVAVPASMQGRSAMRLAEGRSEGWRNEAYFEMSEFVTGRGLRTPQYTYAAAAPKLPGWRPVPRADKYVEYILYDLFADPYQHVNLAGRVGYQKASEELRARLAARMLEASGEKAPIEPCWFPYP